MDGAGVATHDVAMLRLLVGAVTGQYELSEEDRRAVGEWTVDHAGLPEVRELLIKIVSSQVVETSEFRVKVAEAIRDRLQQADGGSGTLSG